MEERKKITIYCPGCKRKAFDMYAGSGLVIKHKCSKCNKMVVYNPKYGVELKPIQQRECSSGMTFV